jgi:hypothetical protein
MASDMSSELQPEGGPVRGSVALKARVAFWEVLRSQLGTLEASVEKPSFGFGVQVV